MQPVSGRSLAPRFVFAQRAFNAERRELSAYAFSSHL